ncbi:hypothetical protein K7432_011941 [Basidiobolus ranarum]|uniref:Uncharacterized protein n=1 Tax=Basidiobolus ranarum TaxID=34480 RepID=A0ABR2VT20_9FUNG
MAQIQGVYAVHDIGRTGDTYHTLHSIVLPNRHQRIHNQCICAEDAFESGQTDELDYPDLTNKREQRGIKRFDAGSPLIISISIPSHPED